MYACKESGTEELWDQNNPKQRNSQREKKYLVDCQRKVEKKYEKIQQMWLEIKKNKLILTYYYETLRLHSEKDIIWIQTDFLNKQQIVKTEME